MQFHRTYYRRIAGDASGSNREVMERVRSVPTLMKNGATLQTTKIPIEGGKNVIFNLIKPTLPAKPLTFHFDVRSQMGQFGWAALGSMYVPYVFRTSSVDLQQGTESVALPPSMPFNDLARGPSVLPEPSPNAARKEIISSRYVALRIVNQKLFPCFFNVFKQEFFDIITIPSFNMSDYERRNYNDINTNHCESMYGLNSFQKEEQVLALDDVIEIYDFLRFIMQRLAYHKNILNPNFGYMMLTGSANLVPFFKIDGVKFVPMYYFEGDRKQLTQKLRVLPHLAEAVVKILIKLQNNVVEPGPIQFVNFREIRKLCDKNMHYRECWLPYHAHTFLRRRVKHQEHSILRSFNCDGMKSNEIRYYNCFRMKELLGNNNVGMTSRHMSFEEAAVEENNAGTSKGNHQGKNLSFKRKSTDKHY